MAKHWLFIVGLIILLTLVVLFFMRKGAPQNMKNQSSNTGLSLVLVSPVFRDGTNIPIPYTCKGQNVSPPLNITGVPGGAKSLALIMHDPDAVSGDFVHWIMWDIPARAQSIAVNSVPVGAVVGPNGGSQNKYMGPCPPPGTGIHHYLFELYALNKTLGLPPATNRDQLQKAMASRVIAKTTLTGLFFAD